IKSIKLRTVSTHRIFTEFVMAGIVLVYIKFFKTKVACFDFFIVFNAFTSTFAGVLNFLFYYFNTS
ncbi:MAG: hypothetical protein WCE60_08010, partial [Methanobacterium sp.]